MSSFDKIIRNILADIFAEEEQQQVTRPKARPEGLMSSLRPQARPEDVDPIQPSASEATSKFTKLIGDNEDIPEEGVEIPLNELKINARDMEGRYQTSAAEFYRLNKGISSTGSKVKVAKLIPDTEVDELTSEINMILDNTPTLKPRARPKSVEEIQAIRASQEYTDLDTTRGLQAALNNAGITVNGKPLVEDGIMGPLTKKAIRAFQKDKELKVDGIAGPITKQALYGVAPKPEITEEELPPIKEETLSVPLSEGLAKRPGIKTLDFLKGTVKDLEDRYTTETSKLINETRDTPDLDIEKSTKAITRIDASVFGVLGEALGSLGLGTAEFRFFGNNIIKPGGTYTEKDLNTSDKKLLKKAIASAKADDRNYIDYEKDLGVEEMEVNKASPFAGIADPAMRMARSIGVFSFTNDKDGNTIIEDTFDFNPGPKRIAYYEALKKGDKKEALYLLSPLANTSPVEAASMIGYARQENLKAKGEAYQTIIRINLGKV